VPREQQIQQLLEQAQQQRQAGRLIEPPGDNAFESYNQVLDLEPLNSQARAGLLAIGSLRLGRQHEQEARALLAAGDLQASLAKIEIGLLVAPTYPGLIQLRDEVRAKLADGQ
jgi:hypothetical protein